MAAVHARSARIVEQSRQGLREWLGSLEGVTLVKGQAQFVMVKTLRKRGPMAIVL